MEHKEIKLMKLCFENVEVVEIDPKYFGCISLEHITSGLINDWYSNETHTWEEAEDSQFTIRPEGNIKLEDSGNADNLFERILMFNDLVSIEFIYKDGTNREIQFNWNTENEYKNTYQSALITENGFLVVCISKKHKAEEYKKSVEQAK